MTREPEKSLSLAIAITRALDPHRWLYLSEVRSDATWCERPLGYRFRTITVVTVDDHDLRGLALVAGEPPVEELPHHWTARARTQVRSALGPDEGEVAAVGGRRGRRPPGRRGRIR